MSSSVFEHWLDDGRKSEGAVCAERAVEAMRQMSASAREYGISELSLEEINKEIAAARESGQKQK